MASKGLLLVIVGLFHIEDVISAPLVFLPQSIIPAAQAHQEGLLQEQLQALQPPLDWLLRPPLRLNTPLLIRNPIIPIIEIGSKKKTINDLENEELTKRHNETNSNFEDNGDEDSIVIEADKDMKGPQQQRVTYLLASGQRFSVGSIIGAIPFLPIEINVPDSIAWIWNGISGIISGFGQRWPFRPRPETPRPLNEELLKMINNQEINVGNQMVMPNMEIPIVILVPYGVSDHFRRNNEIS